MASNASPGLQQIAHKVYIYALNQANARNACKDMLDGVCVLLVHIEVVSLGIGCFSGGFSWPG